MIGLVFLYGLSTGHMTYTVNEILETLIGKGSKSSNFTLITLRMPRLIMTFFLGMGLAVSGGVLQTLTKNDLADPGIIGINSGAGIGITVGYLIFSFDTSLFPYMMPIMAFIGAMLTFFVTLTLSYEKYHGFNMQKLILLGIGSAIALSGIMVLFISSAERQDVQFIQSWLSGNIWGDTWTFVYVVVPTLIVLVGLIVLKIPILNIMNLNDFTAQSLGIHVKKERAYLILLSVAVAAVSVSVAGAITFIGLITPHLSKRIFGPEHQGFLPGSMLLGGLFLMSADIIGRTIFQPQGLLAGIVVSIIGAPYFIYLIIKKAY